MPPSDDRSQSPSSRSSYTDASNSTDDTWDPIYPEDIESVVDTGSRRGGAPVQYRTTSQPAPENRRGASRRQATSDHSSGPSAPRNRRPVVSVPGSSVASDEYSHYGRGYPPQPPYAGRGGYPPQGYGPGPGGPAFSPPPFGAAPGSLVPFGAPPSHGYPSNPFAPMPPPGPHNAYFPPGAPYGMPGQPPPPGFTGHELMPYGQQNPYGNYPPYGAPHPGQGPNGSPYYGYAMPAHPESPKPATPAPAPAPAPEPAPAPAPAPPPIDPEITKKLEEGEKKLADLQKALAESNKVISDQIAAEQKAKEDAERAAATNKRIAEEVAKVKAQMEADAAAKAIAAAKAKFEAEVAAKAAAEAAAAKAKAEKEAKERFEAEVKAKYEEEVKAAAAKAEEEMKAAAAKAEEEVKKAKAEADAAKALVGPPEPEKKKPIKFKDAVGRKFSFPFHLCQTWQGMEDLIKQAFLHVEPIGTFVQQGHYDLVGPNGEIILPQVWETMIEPDWAITMHMWPMPEPKEVGPPPPPEHHGPMHVPMPKRPGKAGAKGRDRPPPPPGWIGPPPGAAGPSPGIVVIDDTVPKPPKKKAQNTGWSLFGAPSKKSGGSKKAKK